MSTITTQSWNQAIAEQFPWIGSDVLRSESGEYLEPTERIAVAKVSPELLEVVPHEDNGTELSGYWTHDVVEFWTATGKRLGGVKPRVTHADARDMRSDRDGESIGDALALLPEPGAVAFVTRYEFVSSGVLSHSPNSRKLTVFKVADFTITEWLEARREEARLAVEAAAQAVEAIALLHEIFTKSLRPERYWYSLKDGSYERQAESGDRRLEALFYRNGEGPLSGDGWTVEIHGLRSNSADRQLIGVYKSGEGPEEDDEGYEVGPSPLFYVVCRSERTAFTVSPMVGGKIVSFEIVWPETARAEGWGRPDDDLGPLSSLKGTDNPISRAAAAGLTYDQARKAVDGE